MHLRRIAANPQRLLYLQGGIATTTFSHTRAHKMNKATREREKKYELLRNESATRCNPAAVHGIGLCSGWMGVGGVESSS